MSVITKTSQKAAEERPAAAEKVRCVCGKWWAFRGEGKLILRCKLCRRDIVVTGENLKITYR